MSEQQNPSIGEWANDISAMQMIPWSSFPELDLYMDQVITLMHRQFDPLTLGTDRPLTPSMINNYVKDGVMPRPNQKKYNREHLTVLALICMLKSEFALPEIRALVEALNRFYSSEELYTAFTESQVRHLHEAIARVAHADEMPEAERYKLAMDLALEANAKRIAAAKLLSSLTPDPSADKQKEKKKKKDDTDKE